ncbi:hypothetical protein A2U01_0080896, partial [Trifolium medium]|nr:hypothetical protein [Trifolium medium]
QARALRMNPKVKPPQHKQHGAQCSTIRRAAQPSEIDVLHPKSAS